MGLVDELRGSRIFIDTAPIIYFIEKNHRYLNIVRPVFVEIDAGWEHRGNNFHHYTVGGAGSAF
ncbi:MAG: hypothetical protein HWN68_06940 [Desulfobacterales bacterium]|nr:hypothetical protein [Desulfobacterales bacterium]